MNNKLTLMYVHGLNSNGNSSTGKTIEKLVKQYFPTIDIVVKHPTFSKDCNEALSLLKEEAKDCDIVIGTSLGGFLALNAKGVYRIIVNPALHPSVTLLELGESSEVASSYKNTEHDLISSINEEDKGTLVGYFADNDTVVNNKDEFKQLYGENATHDFHGEHRMNKNVIKEIIIPEVLKYIEMRKS